MQTGGGGGLGRIMQMLRGSYNPPANSAGNPPVMGGGMQSPGGPASSYGQPAGPYGRPGTPSAGLNYSTPDMYRHGGGAGEQDRLRAESEAARGVTPYNPNPPLGQPSIYDQGVANQKAQAGMQDRLAGSRPTRGTPSRDEATTR